MQSIGARLRGGVVVPLVGAVLSGCGVGGSGSPGIPAVPAGPVTVVLIGSLDKPDHDALYGYDANGNFVRRLSGAIGEGWGVDGPYWSPDRSRLAFTDDKETADR